MELKLPILGIAGSTALLAYVLAAQFMQGLDPCPLCIWQRWPHLAAILLGLVAMLARRRWLFVLPAASLLIGTAIAGYHVGVEQHWWAGLDSCAGEPLVAMSGTDLLDLSEPVTVTRCDEVVWSFLGLSMAAWNGLVSTGLAIAWMLAAWMPGRLAPRSG